MNKGISIIEYNSLNLPQELAIKNTNASGKIYYTYSASGVKLKTVHLSATNQSVMPTIGVTTNDASFDKKKTTDYVGNMIYENGTLKRTLIDGGYVENNVYHFYLTDHLGNNRVVAKADGTVMQKNHYYPFGMAFTEKYDASGKQPFKYNGKELDSEMGLNTYDYSARTYEPAYGRFMSVDPLAEKKPWLSPYAYCRNNPIRYIDPDGMDEWEINEKGEITKTAITKKHDASFLVDKEGNRMEGQSLYFDYGTVNSETVKVKEKDKDGNDVERSYEKFTVEGSQNASSWFNFITNESNVEWSHSTFQNGDGSTKDYLTTSKNERLEGGISPLWSQEFQAGNYLKTHTHNHPYGKGRNLQWQPSGVENGEYGDIRFARGITDYQKGKSITPEFYIKIQRRYQWLPYSVNSVPKDFPFYVKP